MTFKVILHLMKNLRLSNVSLHRFFFYQNRFTNECVRKKKAKIPVSQSKSFFVRYRRTYVPKNTK